MNRLMTALLATIVVACGRSDRGQPPQQAPVTPHEASAVRSCNRLTRDQVSAALGSPVAEGQEQGPASCAWKAGPGARVSIQVFEGSMLSGGTCATRKSLLSGPQEDVSGLGDSARWSSAGELVVCTAKAVLAVNIENPRNSPDENRETAITLARAALDLPANASIGVATMEADGTIVLTLRASSPGALGDAQLRYPRTHKDYDAVLKHVGGLRPGESKPVPPWPDSR